jgi:hypothetical protein
MENKSNPTNNQEKSILDQIISNQTAEEVANLNVVQIINDLFSELNERERDVLVRRFGLHGNGKETLENIGVAHGLTRERIRQIETVGVKKLLQLRNLEQYIAGLKKVIQQLLEEHGGFMERDYLIKNLVKFSTASGKGQKQGEDFHKNYLEFLISKLLHADFSEVNSSKNLKSLFKLKYKELDHIEEFCEELLDKVKEAKKILSTKEIVDLVKGEVVAYKKHEDKLLSASGDIIDVSEALKNPFHDEDSDLVNTHKVIYSALRASKKIEQNKFGHWGHDNWREIKPKTINDKVYLVLKNAGKPMHFAEIADVINKMEFDHKKANAATVHNELILDKKYVLVGRGLYALKEWGYKQGTVADVVENVLRSSGEPLDRDEIINRVLEQRTVKRATIILALMDKAKFDKQDGKYMLKTA